jgi:nitric oxide reductase NorE protein
MTNATTMARPMHAGSDAPRHLPGDSSVWLFVIGDMVIFSCYFAAYMFDRGQNHGLFLQSQQQLSRSLGIINSLILLTSSLFVALSVQAARAGNVGVASRLLSSGSAFGIGFVLIKSLEWYLKLRSGLTISSNAFFMHYYMITSLHCFHVLLGLVILRIVGRELRGASAPRVAFLEIGGHLLAHGGFSLDHHLCVGVSDEVDDGILYSQSIGLYLVAALNSDCHFVVVRNHE